MAHGEAKLAELIDGRFVDGDGMAKPIDCLGTTFPTWFHILNANLLREGAVTRESLNDLCNSFVDDSHMIEYHIG